MASKVEVTQADRDAAADWYHYMGEDVDLIAEFRAGKHDVHPKVQAFARHRQQAIAKARGSATLVEGE